MSSACGGKIQYYTTRDKFNTEVRDSSNRPFFRIHACCKIKFSKEQRRVNVKAVSSWGAKLTESRRSPTILY